MGAVGVFAPRVFEKDHIAPKVLTKIILILRICTYRIRRVVKIALTV